MGVDLEGFFVLKRYQNNHPAVDLTNKTYKVQQPREELFRAMRFEQRRINQDRIEFVNLDDDSRYIYQHGKGGAENLYTGSVGLALPNDKTVESYRVDVRNFSHEDFRSIIQALIYLAQAAKSTGNPIIWS